MTTELDALFQALDTINEERRQLDQRERDLRKTGLEKCKFLITQFGLTERDLFPTVFRQ